MSDNIIKIESPDKKWRAEISARLGANITKLQFENKNVFVPLVNEEQIKENPYIQGCPILLPANRTYKGEFVFDGIKYSLPLNEPHNNAHLHGFVHTMPFNVVENEKERVVLEYVNNGDIYPFPFKIITEYSLKDNKFFQCYNIKNIGDRNMPFTFALHTSFVEPDIFSVPISSCQEKDEHHIPTGRFVPLNEQEKNYALGSKSKGLEISGYYKSCGTVARIGNYKYIVSDNFDHWVLYNGKGESGLLCVEPQCGKVNGLNIKDGHRVLEPNAQEIFSTEIIKDI